MVYVGIDVGGTGLKAGVVDENGKILSKVSCPTLVERGAEPVVTDMARALETRERRFPGTARSRQEIQLAGGDFHLRRTG